MKSDKNELVDVRKFHIEEETTKSKDRCGRASNVVDSLQSIARNAFRQTVSRIVSDQRRCEEEVWM